LEDLKRKTVRGGVVKSAAQIGVFVLRIGSIAVLARLLEPADFGLVGMVTAITGVLLLFKDAGLSLPTIQRPVVTQGDLSTLFWVNVAFGAVLMLLVMATAPLLAHLYGEPRLVGITIVVAPSFLIAGLGVQHAAMLARNMRFAECAILDVSAIFMSVVVAILMAWAGFGYWSLTALAIVQTLVHTCGAVAYHRWMPGRPHRDPKVLSMMKDGALVSLNTVVSYAAFNIDKVLIGKRWGAEPLGVYGRAYQLVNIPSDNLGGAIGTVVISAMSRLQHDRQQFKQYFLSAFTLFMSLVVPSAVACALLPEELVYLLLGSKWHEAADVVRYLSPSMVASALINAPTWMLFASGQIRRSMVLGLTVTPLLIAGYLVGLPYGIRGVSMACSAAMLVFCIPYLSWALRATPVTLRELLVAASRPMVSGAAAAAAVVAFEWLVGDMLHPIVKLLLAGALLLGVFSLMLLFVFGQKEQFVAMFRNTLRKRAADTPAET
jgi:PST family polysaccharide transporter